MLALDVRLLVVIFAFLVSYHLGETVILYFSIGTISLYFFYEETLQKKTDKVYK